MTGYLDAAYGLRLLMLGVIALWAFHFVVGAICDRLPLCTDRTCPEHHA